MKAKKIIIVDDNKELLELFGYGLRSSGWKVMLAEGASDFWERLKQIRPSVILLDMTLLEGSGLDVARQLKEKPPYRDIPIVAMSGFSSRREAQRCFEAGCSAILSKPFHLADLHKTLMDLAEATPQQIGANPSFFTKPKARALRPRDLPLA